MAKKVKLTTTTSVALSKAKKTFAEQVAEKRGYRVHKSKK